MSEKPKGPVTLWLDYGYEGWHPKDFETVQEALEAEKHVSAWVIMMPAKYTVTVGDER